MIHLGATILLGLMAAGDLSVVRCQQVEVDRWRSWQERDCWHESIDAGLVLGVVTVDGVVVGSWRTWVIYSVEWSDWATGHAGGWTRCSEDEWTVSYCSVDPSFRGECIGAERAVNLLVRYWRLNCQRIMRAGWVYGDRQAE